MHGLCPQIYNWRVIVLYFKIKNHHQLNVFRLLIDDLAIAAKDPKEIVAVLMEKFNFKVKGTGPIAFHLGMDFFWDEHGVL